MSAKIRVPRAYRYDAELQRVIDTSGHFFDVDSMRFFNSRVSWASFIDTRDGLAFITSERNDMTNAPRLYTIREWVRATGNVRTVGSFQMFDTLTDARHALHEHIARGTL